MSMPDQNQPDPEQGHAREWPSTPYSDEVRAAEPREAEASVVALLGDCTVACSYFPPANRPENHLAVRLRRAFAQPSVVRNFGCDGESAGGLLNSGRLERILATLARLDVAFIRYGINDRKQHGIDGCVRNLGRVTERLLKRFPSATIVIESGLWVDYPAHYLWDRNSRLRPLYEQLRAFSAAQRFRFLDIFAKTQAETAAGNWDLRIRGIPGAEGRLNIIDDSFDEFYGADPAFFTNIHPNSRCVKLIAQLQCELLRDAFGTTLPGPWGAL